MNQKLNMKNLITGVKIATNNLGILFTKTGRYWFAVVSMVFNIYSW